VKPRSFLVSPAIQKVLAEVPAAVQSTSGVLISGEQGTGRTALARAIHLAAALGPGVDVSRLALSESQDERFPPFVVVDCQLLATIRDLTLFVERPIIGDELAEVYVDSPISKAQGGTLYLSQFHCLPMRLQLRLAQLLRDREMIVPETDASGASRPVAVTFRSIASLEPWTLDEPDNRITPELRRWFSGPHLFLPTLRRRQEDIQGVVKQLLSAICHSDDLPPRVASRQVVALLSRLPWKGNLHELKALLRTLAHTVPNRLIRLDDLLQQIALRGEVSYTAMAGTLKEAREQFERDYITSTLERHDGRVASAASALGIQRTNLYRKLRQLSVTRGASVRQVRTPTRTAAGTKTAGGV
jgi:two-component system nitrogen regulation response regulator NtrX